MELVDDNPQRHHRSSILYNVVLLYVNLFSHYVVNYFSDMSTFSWNQ